MRLKWKNGCAGTGVTNFRFCPWHMDGSREGQWPLGVSIPGRRQPGPHCRFYLSVVTAKLHTGFWQNPQQIVKKWRIPRFINTDKAPPMVARLFCSNAKSWCPSDVEHRQIKLHRNNVIECDRRQTETDNPAPRWDFKSMKTAYATIKVLR